MNEKAANSTKKKTFGYGYEEGQNAVMKSLLNDNNIYVSIYMLQLPVMIIEKL